MNLAWLVGSAEAEMNLAPLVARLLACSLGCWHQRCKASAAVAGVPFRDAASPRCPPPWSEYAHAHPHAAAVVSAYAGHPHGQVILQTH